MVDDMEMVETTSTDDEFESAWREESDDSADEVRDSVLFSQPCRFAIAHWWILGQFITYCYNL